MNSEEVEHIRKLIGEHSRRLRVLEIQAARFGDQCPPQVLIEIEDIRQRIAALLRQLDQGSLRSFPQTKNTLSQIGNDLWLANENLRQIVREEKRVYKFLGIPIWTVSVIVYQTLQLLPLIVGGGIILGLIGFAVTTSGRLNPTPQSTPRPQPKMSSIETPIPTAVIPTLIPASTQIPNATLLPIAAPTVGVKSISIDNPALRAVTLNPDARLRTPLIVSVRQTDQSWRVALASPNQSNFQYVDTQGDAYDASVSPDGKYLAFVSSRDGVSSVYSLDMQNRVIQQIAPPDMDCQFPVWSPDARAMMYTCEPPGGPELVARNYIYDTVSGQHRLLADIHSGWPDWSSDNKIVFTSWTGKSFDLFQINPDGTGKINLTSTDDRDEDIAAWSPNGQQIAFVVSPRHELDQRQIFVMNQDGTNVRQLTSLPGPNSNPVWSPDGQTIAFANQVHEGWQPWLMNNDGTGLMQLSANDDRIWFMNWVSANVSFSLTK